MKTPRVNDFDPDAKVPILKSSLDNMPSIVRRTNDRIISGQSASPIPNGKLPKLEQTSKVEKKEETKLIRDVRPVRPVPPVPPKRVMKQRWPVDIYQDQYESLQQLSLAERMRGGVGSMSAMVREALDRLIKDRKEDKL